MFHATRRAEKPADGQTERWLEAEREQGRNLLQLSLSLSRRPSRLYDGPKCQLQNIQMGAKWDSADAEREKGA
jgi:hypothetical protein